MNIDISKYLNIPFKHHGRGWHGVDCYGLLMLFYKTEFQITLPNHNGYDADSKHWDFDYIQNEYRKCFERIATPIRYCAVGFRILGSKVMNHIGIMLDDASFLHIPRDQMVCIDKISQPFWRKSIHKFYRIKDKEQWQT